MFKPKPKKIVPPDRLYINGSLPNTELDLCTPEKSKRCPTCAARASLWTLRRACEYLHSEAVPGEPELRPALLVGVVSASRWRKVRALQRLCWVGRSVGRSVVGTPDRFPIERRVFVGLEHPRQRVGPRVWRKSKKIKALLRIAQSLVLAQETDGWCCAPGR